MQWQFDQGLAPNHLQLLLQLQTLFSHREFSDGMVELSWTPAQGAGMSGRHFACTDVETIAAEAARLNTTPGVNVYVGGALRLPDTVTDSRAHDSDHYATTAVWVDLDSREAAEQAVARTRHLPPSMVITTGNHPHVRMQLWWVLQEPITDATEHRRVMQSLAWHLGGDRTVHNPSRIMRLGGSVAWAKKPGRVDEMTGVQINAAVKPYPLEQILRVFPVVPEATTAGAAPGGAAGVSTDRARAAGPLGLPGEILDGREGYMRDLLLAVFIELVGTTGATPTAQELFDAAWPQYAKAVDMSRPGRGPDEMSRKASYLMARFEAGRLPGFRDLDAVVAEWQRKEARRQEPPHPTAQKWAGGDAAGAQDSAGNDHRQERGSNDTGAQPGADQTYSGFGEQPLIDTDNPWADLDVDTIPPRQWVLPGLLIRKHLTVLGAPGGTSKSQLVIQAAIAMALGISWAGWRPAQRYRTLLINAEDDADEMRRRVAAACAVMGVDTRSLAGWLVLAKNPQDLVVAKVDRITGSIVVTPMAEQILATIQHHKVDVVAADPFAETFEGDENSNSDVKWVAAIWRKIARVANCAVMAVHHTAKGSQGKAGNADVVRGASALVNSARIVATMFTMSEDEATLHSISPEERTRYVRFDDAKANLHLVTAKARWFERVSHQLSNGDSVGALRPWAPSGTFDTISTDVINTILDVLKRGRDVDGTTYPYNLQTRHQGGGVSPSWAGYIAMQHGGADAQQAGRILEAWTKSGLLKLIEYKNEQRQIKTGVQVDDTKRPGRVYG